MKILVFSDSHTDVNTMFSIVKSANPDMIIHLGDHLLDALKLQAQFRDIPMEMLKGNNDYSGDYPREKMLTVEGRKIFITHGDRYGVKNGINKVIEHGIDIGADIILFGHTHESYLGTRNDVWIMNPGQIGRKTSFQKRNASYGMIMIEGNDIRCRIVKV